METMQSLEERVLVYTAVLLLCTPVGTFLGIEAGAMTFIHIVSAIELTYWIAQYALRGGIGPW